MIDTSVVVRLICGHCMYNNTQKNERMILRPSDYFMDLVRDDIPNERVDLEPDTQA